MDRFEAMSVFVSVADLRGFAPAARRLRLSPSAVTRLVAALEEHLGTRLLQRTTRSVTLTDAGTRYLERARRILGDVTEAEGAAQVERTVPTGRLVVTAPSVFGRLHVAPLMGAFLRKFPAITGELSLSDRVVNLVEDGVDLAVRIGALEDSSYVARPVGLVRRVVVASPKYLARNGRPRAPADLARHSVIQFTAIDTTPEWRFIVNGALVRASIAPRYVTNSADAAVGHAERGGGLAMVLSYQAAESVKAGRVEIVLQDVEPSPLPIQIVYPTTRLLSAKVRAFVELCTKTCKWDFTFRANRSRPMRP
jgi:DNA-binding transcriptional LysR family regulator